jgi:hypothetical protein
MRASIKNRTLVDDCALDVSLLLANTAADVFMKVPDPAQALRPTYL